MNKYSTKSYIHTNVELYLHNVKQETTKEVWHRLQRYSIIKRLSLRHRPYWNYYVTDVLKLPPHLSDIQQVLSDQTMKYTVISCRTKQFFIGKSHKSDSFRELWSEHCRLTTGQVSISYHCWKQTCQKPWHTTKHFTLNTTLLCNL